MVFSWSRAVLGPVKKLGRRLGRKAAHYLKELCFH